MGIGDGALLSYDSVASNLPILPATSITGSLLTFFRSPSHSEGKIGEVFLPSFHR